MNHPLGSPGSSGATGRYVLPEFTERTSTGQRSLDPYAKLLDERIVFLGTQVDDISASDVTAQLLHLEHLAPERPISLYINSPGGSFSAMTAIYDTMRYINCEVETTCLGQAASVAAVLLAAGTAGRRYALPGARMLIRQPSVAEPIQGQLTDLAIQAREMLRTRQVLEEMLVLHTGQDPEIISADIERDKILSARDAQEYGLVDQIISSREASGAVPGGR